MVSDEKYIDYLKSYYDKESDDKTKAKAVKSIMDLLKKGTMPQDGPLAYRLAKFIYLRDEIKNSKSDISVNETVLACKLFKIASKSGIDKATDILKEMEVRYLSCNDSRAKQVLDELGISSVEVAETSKQQNVPKPARNEEKNTKATKQSVVSADETIAISDANNDSYNISNKNIPPKSVITETEYENELRKYFGVYWDNLSETTQKLLTKGERLFHLEGYERESIQSFSLALETEIKNRFYYGARNFFMNGNVTDENNNIYQESTLPAHLKITYKNSFTLGAFNYVFFYLTEKDVPPITQKIALKNYNLYLESIIDKNILSGNNTYYLEKYALEPKDFNDNNTKIFYTSGSARGYKQSKSFCDRIADYKPYRDVSTHDDIDRDTAVEARKELIAGGRKKYKPIFIELLEFTNGFHNN